MTRIRINATFLKLLFSAGLIFPVAAVIDTSVDSECRLLNYHLPTNIIPVHYNITLIPYTDTFYGESSIYLEIYNYTQNISLHAYKLQIDNESIELVDYIHYVVRKPQTYSYCTDTQILVLEFKGKIPFGRYILSMKFNGTLRDSVGFVANNYTNQEGHARWVSIQTRKRGRPFW